MLQIPAPVGADAHIRIVSPGLPTLNYIPDRARRAERALFERGFTVSYGGRAFLVSADGGFAGSAQDRAADLMEAFADPSVDAILAADAGQGGRDLLDHLDPATIAANPKPFIGYCDNVFINQFLASKAGVSSLYGCTLMVHIGEAGGPYPETLDYLTRALASADPLECAPVPSRTGGLISLYEPELERLPRERDTLGGWTWLRPGIGRGTLVGGEITLVPELVSCFGLSLRSAVLFWHVGYHDFPVQQLLKKVCDQADVAGLAGMIVGAHPVIPPAEWAATVGALLEEFVPGTAFPVVVNADLSHLCPSWTVPYGEEVILEAPDRIAFLRRP
ncbi:LD-carboxypeptidase [Nonomuraea cavernae]|uniref:LD-carboxypeptidase n=1 Tax=Nonomuraea cavernae TaxID=2045107 RepID=UPI0033C7C4A0